MRTIRLCEIEGCVNKHLSKGYCNMHYIRLYQPKLYGTWRSMLQRCSNSNDPNYKHYGGRGIGVCERWHTFKEYEHDIKHLIGDKPSPRHSIDRINNDGNYEPGNVRWATQTEQLINMRIRSNNTSGVKGVHWDEKNKKWFAAIHINKKMVFLGRFKHKNDAINARKSAEIERML